jgi:hypothetical protein
MNQFVFIMMICRCDAEPDDLDAPGSHRRTHEKTDYLIKNFDSGILWDEYGIRNDIVVCKFCLSLSLYSDLVL